MAGRVLLAQTSFLGDVVLSTALARVIRAARPDWEVWWVVRPEAVPLLTPGFPAVRVIPFDKRRNDGGLAGLLRLGARLEVLGFDAAVGVQRSLRTAALLARARIPLRVGHAGSPGAWLYHRRIASRAGHARDRLVGLAQGLGIELPVEAPSPHLDVDRAAAERVAARLAAAGVTDGGALLVVAPGSAWATKQWPAERFGEAAARLAEAEGARVVVIGTARDRGLAQRIAGRVAAHGGAPIVDATGETTIADAVAWIARARLTLANDSAPAHIAAALGRPVVTLFGPTVPAQGFAPVGRRVRIVERTLGCRPCSRHGGVRCPIGTHECLAELPAADVEAAGRALLDGSRAAGRANP